MALPLRRAHERASDAYRGDAGATYFATLDADDFTRAVIARERARKIQPYVHATDRVLEYGVGCGYNLRFVRCRCRRPSRRAARPESPDAAGGRNERAQVAAGFFNGPLV
jgi:hypothetical protein